MLRRIGHYCARSYALGPRRTWLAIKHKLASASSDLYWRRAAGNKTANSTWKSIQKKHQVPNFDIFFTNVLAQERPPFAIDFFLTHDHPDLLIADAECFVNKCFDLLGSGRRCFSQIAWHEDFRIGSSANCCFDANQYYKDYVIQINHNLPLAKDIKIPWELSRFYHVFVLAKAYQITANEKYAQAFVDQIEDWLDQNQFLFGCNWVCPMEVGIRAINWQWGFYFFRNATCVKPDFWQRFICALYDHLIYLEHNWEIYDSITSNHYLSDLIGYFYLCYLFQDLSGMRDKSIWCHKQLIKEWQKQVSPDGTSYEGSTAYHMLVTEIFYHASMLAKACGFDDADKWAERLKGMIQFIEHCTPVGASLIQIGDNDSGRISYPRLEGLISKNDVTNPVFYFYPHFGLSIFKTSSLHCTVRHHAYRSLQPSGHFHSDIGSVTLSYNGVDILVDPGSYVYTASAPWRNLFRSVDMHNTFYISDYPPIALDEKLFFLALPECAQHGMHIALQNEYKIRTMHRLYEKSHRLHAYRLVIIKPLLNQVVIADWWQQLEGQDQEIQTEWNFILGPQISVENSENEIILKSKGLFLAAIQNSCSIAITDSWFAPQYGIKVSCKKLCWKSFMRNNQKMTTTISLSENIAIFR